MSALRLLPELWRMKTGLFLLKEWDTQENLMNHLKSDHFRVAPGGDEPSQRAI